MKIWGAHGSEVQMTEELRTVVLLALAFVATVTGTVVLMKELWLIVNRLWLQASDFGYRFALRFAEWWR